jgi:hypothetical protein
MQKARLGVESFVLRGLGIEIALTTIDNTTNFFPFIGDEGLLHSCVAISTSLPPNMLFTKLQHMFPVYKAPGRHRHHRPKPYTLVLQNNSKLPRRRPVERNEIVQIEEILNPDIVCLEPPAKPPEQRADGHIDLGHGERLAQTLTRTS